MTVIGAGIEEHAAPGRERRERVPLGRVQDGDPDIVRPTRRRGRQRGFGGRRWRWLRRWSRGRLGGRLGGRGGGRLGGRLGCRRRRRNGRRRRGSRGSRSCGIRARRRACAGDRCRRRRCSGSAAERPGKQDERRAAGDDGKAQERDGNDPGPGPARRRRRPAGRRSRDRCRRRDLAPGGRRGWRRGGPRLGRWRRGWRRAAAHGWADGGGGGGAAAHGCWAHAGWVGGVPACPPGGGGTGYGWVASGEAGPMAAPQVSQNCCSGPMAG